MKSETMIRFHAGKTAASLCADSDLNSGINTYTGNNEKPFKGVFAKSRLLPAVFTSLVLVLLFALFFSSALHPAFAEKGEISVYINGSKLKFDVPPVVIGGRTLVPMRKIFEALGATVDWNQNTQTATATRNGIDLKMAIGSKTYTLNGSTYLMDVSPVATGGRTMIPARVVSEAFGCKVEWDQTTNSVLITGDVKTVSDFGDNSSASGGNRDVNTDGTGALNPDNATEKRMVLGLDSKNTVEATIDGAGLFIRGRLAYDEYNQVWVELMHGANFDNLNAFDGFLNNRYEESDSDENWYYSHGYLKLDKDKRFELEVNLQDSPVQQIRIFGIYISEESGKGRYPDDGDEDKDHVGIDNGVLNIVKSGNDYRFLPVKEYAHNLEVMKTIGNPADHLSTEHLDSGVKASLKKLSDSIVKGAKDNREKLLRIHDWMTENLVYNSDYDNVNDVGVNFDASPEIVDNKRSQCYGFSILFTDLARLQGIPTTKVIGYITRKPHAGAFSKNVETLHSWNISYVDGRWIHTDVTWDINSEISKFVIYRKMPSHEYFDVDLEVFSFTHSFDYFRETHEWY